jgi:hypothetical protein
MVGQKPWASSALVLCAAVFATAWATTKVRADLQVFGYQDRLHDPFYVGADKAFIGAEYDWSGYGRLPDPIGTGLNWKSVAMISDNYFLTASHFKPIRGDDPGAAPKVRFYRTLDPNGEYWESEIAVSAGAYVGKQVGTSDLWVGKLAQTPPSWVTRYPLAKRQEATNYLSYTDNELFVFGQDSPRNATSVRVGRNEISSVSTYGSYQWDYNPSTGLGADEAQTQNGDSGSPSFFISNGQPVLAGVHTRTNYDTGVSGNLTSLIAAVPEPVSLSTGLEGDINGDFRVNFSDLTVLSSSYKKLVGNARYHQGDLTGDGTVDFRDFLTLTTNYNKGQFAPTDFDRDGDVDGNDLATIGSNWSKSVPAFTLGDANGDSLVNASDVEVFDKNEFRAFFGALPAPLSPIYGDVNGNGIVDSLDLNVATLNLNRFVMPGTNGDIDQNGFVDDLDRSIINLHIGDSFGDITGDHQVGVADFLVIASSWNWTVFGGRFQGDFNGDRIVNALDANILFGWWGQENGYFPGMTIPEPASLTLCVAGMFAFGTLCRRR